MIEAIGRYGSKLKLSSYHELRVSYLKNELDYRNRLMKRHKEAWAKHHCSIMSYKWTYRRQRRIINFLINYSLGTMFKSIDTSSFMKYEETPFELLEKFVDEIREQNVVLVITDNGSNYVLANMIF